MGVNINDQPEFKNILVSTADIANVYASCQ